MITYKEQNQDICQVVVNIESGDVLEVNDVSLRIYEDTEYNESYIDESLKQVLGCVSSGRWKKAEVKHVTAEYYIKEDSGVIWDGNIRYLVELKDGSCYSCSYSCAKQRLASIQYMREKQSIKQWYSMEDFACENMHLSRKIQTIK